MVRWFCLLMSAVLTTPAASVDLTPEFDRLNLIPNDQGPRNVCSLFASLELGTRELTAGEHRIRFTSTGKDPVSDNYFFGIDAIDLLPPG